MSGSSWRAPAKWTKGSVRRSYVRIPRPCTQPFSIVCYRKGKPISVMMPYSYQLKDLGDWYRQLWAESLGKQTDLQGNVVNVGPTPVKALGATDQHSQVQLYREGPNDKAFTFLAVEKFAQDVTIGPAGQTL